MRSWGRAAMNVEVFQWPEGRRRRQAFPLGAQPRQQGHVGLGPRSQSMKTKTVSGSIRPLNGVAHLVARRLHQSGRSRSSATSVFF